MNTPWIAEIDLSVGLVRETISDQFPQFVGQPIIELGAGWDMVAYRVGNEFIFRFPRRQMGADLVKIEMNVLPELAPLLLLPIPNPEFIGRPTDRYPWPFAGYKQIAGRTACSLAMSDEQRAALIPSLATFLSALHSLTPDQGRQFGAPEDLYGRLDPNKRIPQAHDRLDKLVRDGLVKEPSPLHRLIDQTAIARPTRTAAIVHGDLYVRHLIVNDTGELSGIIDWGDIHVGDPAIDLSVAFTFVPPQHRIEFRQHYGEIDEPTWQLARFRAITYGLILTDYGHTENDSDILREGQFILASVLVR